MRGLSKAMLAAGLVWAHNATAQIVPTSTTTNVDNADCTGLKLVAAAGVPGDATHKYKFHGLCKIVVLYPKTGSFAGFEYGMDGDSKVLGTVWTDLAATWDSKTGFFKEMTRTQGMYAGEISMVLRCAGDPVLTGVGCQGVAYSNTTGWSGFDGAYAVPRPISRGKTSLAEATALSQQSLASGGSNPPPPPPAPLPSPSPTPTSPSIPRVTVPTRTGPVTTVSPQVVAVAPTRSTITPVPPPPPERVGGAEIALAPAARVELQDGRAIAADGRAGELRWTIVGEGDQLLRRFPAGSKLTESSSHQLTVHYPGGSYAAGQRRSGAAKGRGHAQDEATEQGKEQGKGQGKDQGKGDPPEQAKGQKHRR